jgi:hypothetical protein
MRPCCELEPRNVWRNSHSSRHRPGDGPGGAVVSGAVVSGAVVGGAVVGGAVVGGAVVGGAVVGGAVLPEGGVVVVAVCGAVPLLQAPRTSETPTNPKSKYRRIRTLESPVVHKYVLLWFPGAGRQRNRAAHGICRRTGDGSHILTHFPDCRDSAACSETQPGPCLSCSHQRNVVWSMTSAHPCEDSKRSDSPICQGKFIIIDEAETVTGIVVFDGHDSPGRVRCQLPDVTSSE